MGSEGIQKDQPPEFGHDAFDYARMVNHMWDHLRPDMTEFNERFIRSMKAKLDHPDAKAVTKKEVAEFLTKKERIKIVQVWNELGL